jgi:hypothetical protein
MNKLIVFFTLVASISFGQSFAPAAGQIGSTAIHKDSSVIVNWANGIVVSRGFLNSANPLLGNASFGLDNFGLGIAEADGITVVSLGDGGSATLTFPRPIRNEAGPDFAVFENGFADNYMEFAHVEVSSDGINFVRFPSVSETPLLPQLDNFSYGDCRYVHNLAGKYRQGFGTPFDLQDLENAPNLNLSFITHVRLIDVVGSTDPTFGSSDAFGNLINDSYPTEFPAGGFDLDAIAVLHELPLETAPELGMQSLQMHVFPNPTRGEITIQSKSGGKISLYNLLGQKLFEDEIATTLTLDLRTYSASVLLLVVEFDGMIYTERIFVH